MDSDLLIEIKNIIRTTIGGNIVPNPLPDDYGLVGNVFDSLAVTRLIVALEENYGFNFTDDELSAEAFENALSVAELVSAKIEQ